MDDEDLLDEIEAMLLATEDDDSEARSIWASGHFIVICRPDTPRGYVVRIYPDQSEELEKVDMSPAARP